jgi:hypothetical protein
VYDSGCVHHMAPHRRGGYVRMVASARCPGGWFGMVCFRPDGGSGLSDEVVDERRSLGGGLGYTEAKLCGIWTDGFAVERSAKWKVRDQRVASSASRFCGPSGLKRREAYPIAERRRPACGAALPQRPAG